jgi:hypothetical protein
LSREVIHRRGATGCACEVTAGGWWRRRGHSLAAPATVECRWGVSSSIATDAACGHPQERSARRPVRYGPKWVYVAARELRRGCRHALLSRQRGCRLVAYKSRSASRRHGTVHDPGRCSMTLPSIDVASAGQLCLPADGTRGPPPSVDLRRVSRAARATPTDQQTNEALSCR